MTARRWGATRCTGPNLPADDLEALVTDALLACYTDSQLFGQAVAAHLGEHVRLHQPRAEELTAVQAAATAKQRVRDRYQDDYETGKIAAERYEARARELDTELAALRRRATALQAALEQPALAAVPTDAELSALHAQLDAGIRHGRVDLRKALFRALIDGIDIHDVDDIRPTFRLYDPAAVNADALTAVGEAAGQTPCMANDGGGFASHRVGWS